MSATRLIILAVGFFAAIGAAVLAVNLTSTSPETVREIVEVPSIDTTEILVSTKELKRGDAVKDGSLVWRQWPTEAVTAAHIKRADRPDATEELSGTTARFVIGEGQPVHQNKLVKQGQSFMAAVLPKGKRAVSTKVSPDTAAGGFILPDDRVDVLMTRSIGEENGSEVFSTEPVLRNVRVLAIDQIVQEEDGTPVVIGKTATLELTDEQVRILTVAQQVADRLTLALRSLRDNDETGGSSTDLLGGGNEAGNDVVKIIRYGQSSVVKTQN